jgi:hypothetical protein
MALKAQDRIAKLKQVLDEKNLTKVAYSYFKEVTPVKSGNARKQTTSSGNEIRASYAYAKRLDNGYSKQAPDGMVKPTVDYLNAYIKKQLGK